MGLNIGGKLSDEDRSRSMNIDNPPPADAGDIFGGIDFADDLNDLFGDNNASSAGNSGFDDIFGSSEGNNAFDSLNGGQNDPFGQNQNQNQFGQGQNQFGQGLTGYNGQQVPMRNGPDTFDKALDYSGEAMVSIAHILLEMCKSFGTRTADDIGYLSTNLIKTGIFGLIASIVLCIVASLAGVQFLGITGITQYFLLGFALTAASGMSSLGITALAISNGSADSTPDIRNLPDISSELSDDSTDDYEDSLGDIMEELFGTDDSSDFTDSFNLEDTAEEEPDIPDFFSNEPEEVPTYSKIDFNEQVNNVAENRLLNRKLLVDTFINFLPLNTPNFADRVKLDENSQDFMDLKTICRKVISNITKASLEEVEVNVLDIYETYFSFEIHLERVKGLNKTNEIANEFEIWLRDDPNDTAVNATVTLSGNYYNIIITKGVTAVVTFGDILRQKEIRDFFENEKNKLPMITGIDELGKVKVDDAKIFDTMLIAGKPRSGKSWYVLSILISMMMFNTPEDVQFIIIDPKESNLFKTLSLMPHVAGLHNDSDVLSVMGDIIANEGPRRKRLLSENKCDDIWALRKKGVKLPVLYLIIDEYITIKNKLDEENMGKELDSKLQTLISQLPSLGVRLLIVPHRATGIVNKTNRTMINFTACVRSDIDEVNDTLGIKTWRRGLANPGDIAVKSSSILTGTYVRGAALTTSDEENTELIESIATAFYKMGVDLPDMSAMPIAANRDESYVRQQLINSNRVQYTADNLDDLI